MEAKEILNQEGEAMVVEAIKRAEKATSGEIRVHIENTSDKECMERAQEVFHLLKMDETKEANGVLFYVSAVKQKFSVLGDRGIDAVVPDHFWVSVKDLVIEEFKRGNFAQGLVKGIEEAGEKLKAFFPLQQDDTNELSDEISKS